MGRQLCWVSSVLLVALAMASTLVCACELSNTQAGNVDGSNAATLIAVEQAANVGDSNAGTLLAVEQAANVGDPNAATAPSIEHATNYGDPEDVALTCYFGPC